VRNAEGETQDEHWDVRQTVDSWPDVVKRNETSKEELSCYGSIDRPEVEIELCSGLQLIRG